MKFWKKRTPEVVIRREEQLLQVILSIKDIRAARIICKVESDDSIYISDIVHEERRYNKGYGSLLMKELIAYARRNNFTYLHGDLSAVDSGHRDRLHHFYEKFGFRITIFDSPHDVFYGRIDMRLTPFEKESV